jgi:hypothetical protein
MKIDFNLPDYFEELHPRPIDSHVISIQIKIQRAEYASTCSEWSLFDGDYSFGTFTQKPHFEIAHDSTWDHFGRAYFESHNFQCPEFHYALYSVDELAQQIEAWERQYEQNRVVSAPCVIEEECHTSPLDLYFAERLWDEELYAWIEDFKAETVFARNLWKADEHSCHPYYNTSFSLHQFVKLSLTGHTPQTSAALRPCCRSFLMASCRQLSGDDLLGH